MRIGTLIFAAMAMLTVQCTGPGVEPPVPPTPPSPPPPPPPPVEEVFVIAKKEYNVSRAGGTVRVEVETNKEYSFEIDPEVDWVNEAEEDEPSTRNASSTALCFSVSANNTPDGREAAIVFTTDASTEQVVVRQNREDEFAVTGESLHRIGELGGSFELEVRHNVDLEITFQPSSEGGEEWVTTASETTPASTLLRFDVAQNTGPASRLGYITISGGVEDELRKTITVGQKGRESPAIYASTDYSADGRTTLLQEAGEGAGIDVVIMGDAFTDRLIADGTYGSITRTAMEHLFSEEPYKSFRRLFDVRAVDVVSRNEVYSPNHETALGGVVETNGWGVVTNMSGDDDKCMEYARKALDPGTDLDDVLIITIMNSTRDAAVCFPHTPRGTGDWGRGLGIAYICASVGDTGEAFRRVLQHECGHGFAKLADEYVDYYERIPFSTASEGRDMWERYGWSKNVDYTNDRRQVKWRKFLADSRYTGLVGLYEGGEYYSQGVWRPSEESIMRYNTGGFNAPSREAIYYKIHKTAYGAGWQYDYATFVEWDARNRPPE